MLHRRRRVLALALGASILGTMPGSAAAGAESAPILTQGTHPTYTAVVDNAGNLIRGTGAITAQLLSAGDYEVAFQTQVNTCTFVATVSEVGNAGSEPAAFITVGGRAGKKSAVEVRMAGLDQAHTPVNVPFHLDVAC